MFLRKTTVCLAVTAALLSAPTFAQEGEKIFIMSPPPNESGLIGVEFKTPGWENIGTQATPWVDFSAPEQCTIFSPDVDLVDWGESFVQTRSCQVTQSRFVGVTLYSERLDQTRQLDPVSEFRSVPVLQSIDAIGQRDYVVGLEFSNWETYQNAGGIYSCTEYTPDRNTVDYGVLFTQSRVCQQDQTRSRDAFQRYASGLVTPFGQESQDNTISVNDERQVAGLRNFVTNQTFGAWRAWEDTGVTQCDDYQSVESLGLTTGSFEQQRDCSTPQTRTRDIIDVYANGDEVVVSSESANRNLPSVETRTVLVSASEWVDSGEESCGAFAVTSQYPSISEAAQCSQPQSRVFNYDVDGQTLASVQDTRSVQGAIGYSAFSNLQVNWGQYDWDVTQAQRDADVGETYTTRFDYVQPQVRTLYRLDPSNNTVGAVIEVENRDVDRFFTKTIEVVEENKITDGYTPLTSWTAIDVENEGPVTQSANYGIDFSANRVHRVVSTSAPLTGTGNVVGDAFLSYPYTGQDPVTYTRTLSKTQIGEEPSRQEVTSAWSPAIDEQVESFEQSQNYRQFYNGEYEYAIVQSNAPFDVNGNVVDTLVQEDHRVETLSRTRNVTIEMQSVLTDAPGAWTPFDVNDPGLVDLLNSGAWDDTSDFVDNGGDGETEIGEGTGPFGDSESIVTATSISGLGSNDGGVRQTTNVDLGQDYVSYVFFRRVSDDATGVFYHGPTGYWNEQGQVRYENGYVGTNAYFGPREATLFQKGEWYVSIGHLYSSDTPNSAINANVGQGIYKVSTGQLVSGNTNFAAVTSDQRWRAFLFYANDPNYNGGTMGNSTAFEIAKFTVLPFTEGNAPGFDDLMDANGLKDPTPFLDNEPSEGYTRTLVQNRNVTVSQADTYRYVIDGNEVDARTVNIGAVDARVEQRDVDVTYGAWSGNTREVVFRINGTVVKTEVVTR